MKISGYPPVTFKPPHKPVFGGRVVREERYVNLPGVNKANLTLEDEKRYSQKIIQGLVFENVTQNVASPLQQLIAAVETGQNPGDAAQNIRQWLQSPDIMAARKLLEDLSNALKQQPATFASLEKYVVRKTIVPKQTQAPIQIITLPKNHPLHRLLHPRATTMPMAFEECGYIVKPLLAWFNALDGLVDAVQHPAAPGVVGERLKTLQQIALFEGIHQGKMAQKELADHNVRLTMKLAQSQCNKDLSVADLLNEGTVGLMLATQKFDWRLGHKFSTYATWYIRQTIALGLDNCIEIIHLPAKWKPLYYHLAVAKGEHTRLKALGEKNLEPDWKEFAKNHLWKTQNITITDETLKTYTQHRQQEVLSLDRPIHLDSDESLGSLVPDTRTVAASKIAEQRQQAEKIAQVLKSLTPNERQVIIMRFNLDGEGECTLDDISKQLKVTRERVRQIETKALEKLGHPTRTKQLWGLLDGQK